MSEFDWCERPGSAAAHVLIVDDESHVRALLVRWLTEAGCTCSEARDPEEALERLRERNTDVVTLDIRMPLGSGLDIVHRIAAEFPATSILMVTGADDAQHAVAALTAGASDYLVKPVDREMFLWRVRKALAMQRRRRNGIADSVLQAPRPAFVARRRERSNKDAANFAEGV
jgi:DNA-binding response OmpR family regulator